MGGRRLTRVLAVLVLGAGLMIMPSASGDRAPDTEFPHLPQRQQWAVGVPITTMVSSYVTNVAYVGPSKQWLRLVDLRVTADTAVFVVPNQLSQCRALFGAESPRCEVDRPELGPVKVPIRALAYPVEFEGEDPSSPPADLSELRRFGAEFTHFPPQRIRTVAFGSIPVEATLHLSLETDTNGLPYGIQVDADQHGSAGRPADISDTVGTGRLEVRLSDVRVDGVDAGVGETCRALGDLSVEGRGYLQTGQGVPSGRYNPRIGGLLQGELGVGEFSGCGTGGEDLSPLITAMAGDVQTPVRITQGLVTAPCFSDNVRQPIAEDRCNSGGSGEFPDGDQLPPLPPEYLPPPVQD